MSDLRRRTRRSFLAWCLGIFGAAGIAAEVALHTDEDGIPSALRRVLDFNGRLWGALLSRTRTTGEFKPPARAPRYNGGIGLDVDDFDLTTWTLELEGPGVPNPLSLRLSDLTWAPIDCTAEFRCIEGWSEPVGYSGLRFTDFLRHYGLGRRSGAPWPTDGIPDDLFPYVGLETPDSEYYVSIDMKSMLHPQTTLAWSMNGRPLSLKNGAPLRLMIPIKYGIKNLKRVSRIFFSDSRPRDYWAEQGYDWFAGL